MIRVSLLERALGGSDWVAVTPDGTVVDPAVLPRTSPAAMVVKPVTDALKLGESGHLVRSVNRDQTWAIDAFVLDETVIEKLATAEVTAIELIDEVERLGIVWEILEPAAE